MNSLAQGGQPVDVAETVAWLAAPGLGRRQRHGRARLRPEPDRGLTMSAATYGRIAVGAALGPLRRRPDALPDTRAAARRGRGRPQPPRRLRPRLRLPRSPTRCRRPIPHVLAFPLAIELMAARDFPFGVLGLVHVGNAIEQLRPLDAGRAARPARLGRAARATTRAGARSTSSPRRRSTARPAWRDRSTYLHRESEAAGSGGDRGRGRAAGGERRSGDVPGDIGRRYAAVSGDRNPIHLHGLSRAAVRPAGRDRARHVDQGALPRGAAGAPAGRVHGRGRVQAAGAAAGEGRVRVAVGGRERRFALHDARSGKPHLDGRGQSFRSDGCSGLIGSPAAQSSISVASRRSRVSGCFALITHHVAALRYDGGRGAEVRPRRRVGLEAPPAARARTPPGRGAARSV